MKKFYLPSQEEEKSTLKTIRVKLTTLKQIEQLSNETGLSVNKIINECLKFALDNLDESSLKKNKNVQTT